MSFVSFDAFMSVIKGAHTFLAVLLAKEHTSDCGTFTDRHDAHGICTPTVVEFVHTCSPEVSLFI